MKKDNGSKEEEKKLTDKETIALYSRFVLRLVFIFLLSFVSDILEITDFLVNTVNIGKPVKVDIPKKYECND